MFHARPVGMNREVVFRPAARLKVLYQYDRIGTLRVMRKAPGRPATAVIGYIRVSTAEQADSGAGMAAQEALIRAECDRRGFELARIHTDAGTRGKTLDRPALAAALAELDSGQAVALVVANVDRLSRSVQDFASLLEHASSRGWAVVALDLGVDMTTPSGEMLARVIASVTQYERGLIGQRTRDALAVRKAAGVKLGRPRQLNPEIADLIRQTRRSGATLQGVADHLNATGTTTATGRPWTLGMVRKVLAQEPQERQKGAA